MSLPEEIENYRRDCKALHRKVPSGISERWVSRVTERNLHLLAEKGAEAYLRLFGRGIGEGKVVNLAIKAEIEVKDARIWLTVSGKKPIVSNQVNP